MRVFWFGMDDGGACVLHWHELRQHLAEHHGVELFGPGYSWAPGQKHVLLSQILARHGTPDWIVLDDANARGYVPMAWDVAPKCRIAWREHDWHNGHRIQVAMKIKPDLILGTTERVLGENPPKHGDPMRKHSGWRLVPHPVNTERFHLPGKKEEIDRLFRLGFYGMVNKAYPARLAAMPVIRARQIERQDVWMPPHGGYWRDGRGSSAKTRYNDELAEELRHVSCLWVSGGQGKEAVLKYFEGGASGCFLIGEKPAGWDKLFSVSAFIECPPEEINAVVDGLKPAVREEAARVMFDQIERYHSIPARAFQIMGLLEEAA